jgi:hypothetical protein
VATILAAVGAALKLAPPQQVTEDAATFEVSWRALALSQ